MHQFGAGTNVGNVRDNNEDSYACDAEKDLWIVADGMGGLGFGEVASAITTYTVTHQIREGHGVNQAIELAHKRIKEYAETDGMGTNMGTTIVLLLSHGSLYNVFWVGDSRAYLLDTDGMKQITIDHSLVQTLIDQGELTREEAESDPRKNAVTRALGVQELETVRADSISERWKPGQKILLCSDGLTDCVSDDKIERIMREGQEDQQIVDDLIEAALEGGGKDNVTIVVVSAPKTAKIADTDTHVPAGAGSDDTYVPGPDDTQRNRAIKDPDEQANRQMSLDINLTEQIPLLEDAVDLPVAAVRVAEPAESKRISGPPELKRTGIWQYSSAAAVAAFLLFLAASFQADKPAAGIPENFQIVDSTPALPIERHFPDFDFPDSGKVLQVGLYKNLQGAEQQQSALTRLGLAPHIEKRAGDSSFLYAVMIGPLDDQDHSVVTRTLKQHGLSFFHRQGTRLLQDQSNRETDS
ncbi:MAG: protein phosphatase 2C domain-containing protein [Proteobacteria bacterium]|nr:protein phosphatase 2C domain-containing protein [Pseudomonadota bacterium]